MSIASFFETKKKDLSEESKEGDVAKIVREESSGSVDQEDNVFSDSNNGKEVIHKTLKSLQMRIKQLHDLATSSRESQIKGEGQLTELKTLFSKNSMNTKWIEKETRKLLTY